MMIKIVANTKIKRGGMGKIIVTLQISIEHDVLNIMRITTTPVFHQLPRLVHISTSEEFQESRTKKGNKRTKPKKKNDDTKRKRKKFRCTLNTPH